MISNTLSKDLMANGMCVFALLFLLLLMVMNPPKKEMNEDIVSPGNVNVELQWPDNIHVDIDLWVWAPGDKPVGYSNKSGLVFNLLRDDLGNTADLLDMNYENAYSRGAPSGKWCVNVHYYKGSIENVPVKVLITLKRNGDRNIKELFFIEDFLKSSGEELTIVCWRFDNDSNVVLGSVHRLYTPIRSAGVN